MADPTLALEKTLLTVGHRLCVASALTGEPTRNGARRRNHQNGRPAKQKATSQSRRAASNRQSISQFLTVLRHIRCSARIIFANL
jgi:hypothetical protein